MEELFDASLKPPNGFTLDEGTISELLSAADTDLLLKRLGRNLESSEAIQVCHK